MKLIQCGKGGVHISLPLMSLLTVCWLACVFCAKAEDKPETAESVARTTVCEVVSNPGSFDGKLIELRADVFAGLETNILYDKNCGSKEQLPNRILFVESRDVPSASRGKEYRKFWNLVQAYKEPKGRRHSIVPDKYTVTATVVGRFDAAGPVGPHILPSGHLELQSVRDVVARLFDGSFLSATNGKSSAKSGKASSRERKPQ